MSPGTSRYPLVNVRSASASFAASRPAGRRNRVRVGGSDKQEPGQRDGSPARHAPAEIVAARSEQRRGDGGSRRRETAARFATIGRLRAYTIGTCM